VWQPPSGSTAVSTHGYVLVIFVLFPPVFWVAVLLKQYLAIGFNDFLAHPTVTPTAISVSALIAAIVSAWDLSGALWRRRLIVALISSAATASVLVLMNLTNWFASPSIGLAVGVILGAGGALVATSLSVGLSNKNARFTGSLAGGWVWLSRVAAVRCFLAKDACTFSLGALRALYHHRLFRRLVLWRG
jgi:hypothetical protein